MALLIVGFNFVGQGCPFFNFVLIIGNVVLVCLLGSFFFFAWGFLKKHDRDVYKFLRFIYTIFSIWYNGHLFNNPGSFRFLISGRLYKFGHPFYFTGT